MDIPQILNAMNGDIHAAVNEFGLENVMVAAVASELSDSDADDPRYGSGIGSIIAAILPRLLEILKDRCNKPKQLREALTRPPRWQFRNYRRYRLNRAEVSRAVANQGLYTQTAWEFRQSGGEQLTEAICKAACNTNNEPLLVAWLEQ